MTFFNAEKCFLPSKEQKFIRQIILRIMIKYYVCLASLYLPIYSYTYVCSRNIINRFKPVSSHAINPKTSICRFYYPPPHQIRPDCGISKYDALNILLASTYVDTICTYKFETKDPKDQSLMH